MWRSCGQLLQLVKRDEADAVIARAEHCPQLIIAHCKVGHMRRTPDCPTEVSPAPATVLILVMLFEERIGTVSDKRSTHQRAKLVAENLRIA
jgi:hypothetical protein